MSNTIGQKITLSLPSFNKSVEAKVDTGATTCCLHGLDIRVNHSSNDVSFQNPDLSSNVIRMPLVTEVDVHSADNGADTRPVVQLDVSINGQMFKDVHFNINDRSAMDTKVLIGQNLLKAGEFVVDVNEADLNVVSTEPTKVELDGAVNVDPAIVDDSPSKNAVVEYNPETESYTITITSEALAALRGL